MWDSPEYYVQKLQLDNQVVELHWLQSVHANLQDILCLVETGLSRKAAGYFQLTCRVEDIIFMILTLGSRIY